MEEKHPFTPLFLPSLANQSTWLILCMEPLTTEKKSLPGSKRIAGVERNAGKLPCMEWLDTCQHLLAWKLVFYWKLSHSINKCSLKVSFFLQDDPTGYEYIGQSRIFYCLQCLHKRQVLCFMSQPCFNKGSKNKDPLSQFRECISFWHFPLPQIPFLFFLDQLVCCQPPNTVPFLHCADCLGTSVLSRSSPLLPCCRSIMPSSTGPRTKWSMLTTPAWISFYLVGITWCFSMFTIRSGGADML